MKDLICICLMIGGLLAMIVLPGLCVIYGIVGIVGDANAVTETLPLNGWSLAWHICMIAFSAVAAIPGAIAFAFGKEFL
jgi:hypothetical protein